ncbi:hypothetical protein MK398_11465, partial [Streptococcus sanguinis]|nr:hypothetical protein [Streptococcus sanguinis]
FLVYPDFSQNLQTTGDWLNYAMLTCFHYDKWENLAGYKMISFSAVQYNPIIKVLFAVSKYSTVNI